MLSGKCLPYRSPCTIKALSRLPKNFTQALYRGRLAPYIEVGARFIRALAEHLAYAMRFKSGSARLIFND